MAIPFVDETRLVALIQDPATTSQVWVRRGACVELALPDDAYFPADDEVPSVEALGGCCFCPVRNECLATALAHEAVDDDRFGWWGGLSPAERDLLWARLDLPGRQPVEIDFRDLAAVARYLRAQRHTISAIAAALGCSERTVYRYLAATAA
jgi:hypothetical protein